MKTKSITYERNNQKFEINIIAPKGNGASKDSTNVYTVQVYGNNKKLFYTGMIDVVFVQFLEKERGVTISDFLTSAAKSYIDGLWVGASSVL